MQTAMKMQGSTRLAKAGGNSRPACPLHPAQGRAVAPRPHSQPAARVHIAAPPAADMKGATLDVPCEVQADLQARSTMIQGFFPTALGVDDFMCRVEVALSGFGFTGDNSIAMTNLCRDEVTIPLKDKIEAVFGSSFNTNGLGAVLTCGVTGMGAGLSHSPVADGKEHYVFFAFPHIAINSCGEVGAIARPGRPNKSCACGALQKCLIELKNEGYEDNCKVPGVHDPLDPEYSILKQRLARRARYEKVDVSKLDLVSITKMAERTISNDLEFLVDKAVDTKRANYAVITGVQVHNWATELTPEAGIPSFEFVAATKCYVVVNGKKTHIDLTKVPALSPRQLQLMAKASITKQKDEEEVSIARTGAGTLKEIPLKYLTQRLGVTKDPEDLSMIPASTLSWTNNIITTGDARDSNAPTMADSDYTSFQVFAESNPSKEAVLDATPAAVTALLAEIQNLSSRVMDLEKKSR